MLQQFKKRKKTIAILAVILIFLIIIIFFLKNDDKNLKIGNTKSNKSIEDIEEYILNLSSYEATVAVTVVSNKNENIHIHIFANTRLFLFPILSTKNPAGICKIRHDTVKNASPSKT